MPELLKLTSKGLFCEAGDFFIDPWAKVNKAVTTHAHSDHARAGSKHYLCAAPGEQVLKARIGWGASVQALAYGEPLLINDVKVSFHPAGHILGSAQIRVEHQGEVWVVSGDYKVEQDYTCEGFEPVACHTFITECTFGLPIYRWKPQQEVFAEINNWWKQNQSRGRCSVIFGYGLGKAQRVHSGLDPNIGPVFLHGAVAPLTRLYEAAGVQLPSWSSVNEAPADTDWSKALVIAPPSAGGTPWMKRFGDSSTAFASGWMAVRGTRRWGNLDAGFALSDHTDWPGLLASIKATGAEHVIATHGYSEILARYLQEQGLQASVMATRFKGESVDNSAEEDLPEEETP